MVECGLTNLASCLPEMFFQYILSIVTSPLQWLLDYTRDLISQPVNLELFAYYWQIVVYLLSFFYAILLMYAGLSFIISGHDVQKRENSKNWLRNVVIMIIFVQASYFIYSLTNDLSSTMTAGVLNFIPSDFYMLQVDSIANFTLQLVFSLIYLAFILLTILLFIIRYGIIAIGVMLFPLSIFAYFIMPIRHYGLIVLNFLGTNIFSNFISSLILLGFSKLVLVPFFEGMSMLVMATAFGLVNLVMIFITLFAPLRAGMGAYRSVTGVFK